MKNKYRYLFIFIFAIVLFALFDSAISPDSTESASTPAQAATPTATEVKQEAEPTPTPTAESFTVEHDDEYYETQEYIYKFLTEKGFEVQTIIGVPNIGRYEDANPDDNSVGWYAYVKHNGEWTEFVVMLYNGEVSSVLPNK